MAGVELRRGPNRWVVLQSGRDRSTVLERFAQIAPAASGAVATPITGAFEGNAIATRAGLSPVPRAPRNPRPFLLDFEGDGGIIAWPGSLEHDPMLALDAVLAAPAGSRGSPPSPDPPQSEPPNAPPVPAEEAPGPHSVALQATAATVGLALLWWLLSRH